MLEAMQEHQVTIGEETYALPILSRACHTKPVGALRAPIPFRKHKIDRS